MVRLANSHIRKPDKGSHGKSRGDQTWRIPDSGIYDQRMPMRRKGDNARFLRMFQGSAQANGRKVQKDP